MGLMGWIRRLALLALVFGALCLLLVILSGPLTRFDLVHFRTALKMFRWGATGGLAAGVFGVVVLIAALARGDFGSREFAVIGALLGFAAFVPGYRFRSAAMAVPPIHDITTDTADPPAFVAVLPLRGADSNPADYDPANIEPTKQAYADLAPVELALAKDAAFAKALDAAKAMGWTMVESNAEEGRIEATETTTFFGFEDDVVIRVRETEPGKSRVDVRSLSRVGKSDVGANAARIRRYVTALKSGS